MQLKFHSNKVTVRSLQRFRSQADRRLRRRSRLKALAAGDPSGYLCIQFSVIGQRRQHLVHYK